MVFKRKRTIRRRFRKATRTTRRPFKRTRRFGRRKRTFKRRRVTAIGRRGFKAPVTGSVKLYSKQTNEFGKFQNSLGLNQEYHLYDPNPPTYQIFNTNALFRSYVDLVGRHTIESWRTTYQAGGTNSAFQFVAIDWLDIEIQVTNSLNAAAQDASFESTPMSTPTAIPSWWGPNYNMDVLINQTGAAVDYNTQWVKAHPQENGTFKYTIKWRNPLPKSKRWIQLLEAINIGNVTNGGRAEPGGRLWPFDIGRWFTQWGNIATAVNSGPETAGNYVSDVNTFMAATGAPAKGLLRPPVFRFLQPTYPFEVNGSTHANVNMTCNIIGGYRMSGVNAYTTQ